MIYTFAGINVKINNSFAYTDKLCAGYEADDQTSYDVEAEATEAEFAEERAASPEFSDGYIENVCIYRDICRKMPLFDRFLLHCSVVEVDGACYAFLGASGVGKSTHTKLWLKNLPEAKVLNGDKPIIRFDGKNFIAYGVPWKGKECMGYNGSGVLKGLCFLEQAKSNSIEKLSIGQTAERLFKQLLFPEDPIAAAKTLEMCDAMVNSLPSYLLKCDVSDQAFETARAALAQKGADE